MEGPYRDLGSGFARLTGVEGARRSPSHINSVEDALFELLRNARDAGARNIYVASTLRSRRYRTLTVIDDGHGIPESYKDLIFEPGVTTRHLDPGSRPPSAGLSLHHIREAAVSLEVHSTAGPTSLRATFDTHALPERTLQSGTRHSSSNLAATLESFLKVEGANQKPAIYYASPAVILATLIKNRIIETSLDDLSGIQREGESLGLKVSVRTLQRMRRGEVRAVESVSEAGETGRTNRRGGGEGSEGPEAGARLDLGKEEISRIAAILGEAAQTRYLEVGNLTLESRPGQIVLRSRVYEPEEEYE